MYSQPIRPGPTARRGLFALALAALFLLLLIAGTSVAHGQLVPLGPERALQEPSDECGHMFPTLAVAKGGGLLAAWQTEGRLAFRRIEADGSLRSQRLSSLPTYSVDLTPGLDEGVVVTRTYSEALVQPLDAEGNPTDGARAVSSGGFVRRPLITAAPPGGYFAAWNELILSATDRIHVVRLDRDLEPDAPVFTREGEILTKESLVALPDGGAVVGFHPHEYSRTVLLQKLDETGHPQGGPVELGQGRGLGLAADGNTLAAVWIEDESVLVQLLDAESLVPLGLPVAVDDAPVWSNYGPTIRKTPTGWIVFWIGDTFGGAGFIHARLLDGSGEPLAGSETLNRPLGEFVEPYATMNQFDVVITGDRMTVVWQIFRKYRINPVPTPCEYGYRLRTRTFQLPTLPLAEVPALGPIGFLVAVLSMLGLSVARLRR